MNETKTIQSGESRLTSIDLLDCGVRGYSVSPIMPYETYDWLKNKHYLKRIPPISESFGLFDKEKNLKGVCTFGNPVAPYLRQCICGKDYEQLVLELNRLVLAENLPNLASFFVSRAIKGLPRPKIIVSFADASQGHVGYVYQAANFLYTGLTYDVKDWAIRGQEHLHGMSIADKTRKMPNRTVPEIKKIYGDAFYYKVRGQKHRYIYFHGTKNEKRTLHSQLKFEVLSYPKGKTRRFESDYQPQTQRRLF